jgi:amino acid transporter
VFIWTWPVVALGQFIIALNFAEISSHYPVAGSVFQWTKYLANRSYSWMTGWIYLFAGIITVAAVVATLPLALIPALNGLGWHSLNAASLHTQLVVALITLVVITILNIYGVRLVAIINNTGVVFEILGMFVFALILMAFHNHQGFHVVTNSAGFHVNGSTFLAAMFMSLFVIYGFDTASTLAEETKDPRRNAPKAVLFSVIGAFIIGGVFLLGALVAIPNLGTAVKDGYGPAQIIEANFSTGFATLYLFVVSAAIFVCCLSILAATIRLCFGMARDNQLPFSKPLAKVSPSLHTPVWTCIVVALISAIPFIKYAGVGIIAIAATGMIYLSYFLGNLVILRARLRGWPGKVKAPFRLGRWGILVNVLGLIYGGAMLINFAWPRVASNPKPNQTAGLLSLGLGFLNGIPILWSVAIFIALIGAIYYLIVGRTKAFAPVIAPSPDDDAPAVSGPPAAPEASG